MAAPIIFRRGKFLLKIMLNSSCLRLQVAFCTPSTMIQHMTTVSEPIRYFGQPAPHTHPHLIKAGEVTPGIPKQEYKKRRIRLMEAIKNYEKGSEYDHLIIVPSAGKANMTEDINYHFRQQTDFLYLSGFQEPDSVLILEMKNGELPDKHISSLFVPKRDAHRELWDGMRSGIDGALYLTGVSEAYSSLHLQEYLNSYLQKKSNFIVWYEPNQFGHHVQIIQNFLKNSSISQPRGLRNIFHKQRIVKSTLETDLIQKSCDITSEAFKEVMKFSYSKKNEHDLYAKMDFECRIRGAEYLAYVPVVAGGNRACTIHYIANNQFINNRELVLVDAGGEYHGYASDITRTWPVSGKFTASQRKVYDSVLRVQLACIQQCVIGNTLDRIYKTLIELLEEEIKTLNITLKNKGTTNLVNFPLAQKLCPHHVSHYLGMDVHDTETIPRNRPLEHGMIITVEPGLYFPAENEQLPKEYRGIGIRIEDDVLITKEGPVNLTKSCPKDPEEIEDIILRGR